jgi:hypothetical protein
MPRAVALFSGSLDSRLAVRVVQRQGIEVSALYCEAICQSGSQRAVDAAHELDVPLEIISPQGEFIEFLRKPRHGFGRGANPCLDCRIAMFRHARDWMERRGARFVISGEVLGQHPMTQKRRDLLLVAHASGLGDRLLRPLSAQLLAPTAPEREGLVDRTKLHGFSGQGRKGLIELGHQLSLDVTYAAPRGCALAEPKLAEKVFDLLQSEPAASLWDIELLKLGRHISINERARAVLGRSEMENEQLRAFFVRADSRAVALVTGANFPGPVALVIGPCDDRALACVQESIVRYGKPSNDEHRFEIERR